MNKITPEMQNKNNLGVLNQEDILLKPSASDNFIAVGSWVLCIIFLWAFLRGISPSHWYYHIANIIGVGTISYLAYRTWASIKNLRTGKIFLKLTSSGIHYRNVDKMHTIAWIDISNFVIEHDANCFRKARPETETRFYVATNGDSNRIRIEQRFGYHEIDLAELMANKMRQSLDLSSDHELVSVDAMVYGKSVAKHSIDEVLGGKIKSNQYFV